MRTFLFLVVVAAILQSCQQKKESKVINGYNVRALFNKDGTIEGEAEYYDAANRLTSVAYYKNGMKQGPAVHFYENGRKRDSSSYINGLLNGFAYGYDSLGILQFKKYYYFEIPFGPLYHYAAGEVSEYIFTDFDKNELVHSVRDSSGHYQFVEANFRPTTDALTDERDIPILDVLFYFPHPPGTTTETSLWLENRSGQRRNETLLNNNRLFLDTTLSLPSKDWNWNVATHVKSKNGADDKVFLYTLVN